MIGAIAAGGLAALSGGLTACAPEATLDKAAFAMGGLWDAVVPGTWNGIVQDTLENGEPAPGAAQAGVHEWMAAASGTLPPPLDYITDWFLRAWGADLNLWAETFHLLETPRPKFGELPLGPTAKEAGRQYKIILMQELFTGTLDLWAFKYFAATLLGKVAFYGDFWAEMTGAERVGSQYIGFGGPTGTAPLTNFTYNQPFGVADTRLTSTPGGLVAIP
jgi:hypothetical protein